MYLDSSPCGRNSRTRAFHMCAEKEVVMTTVTPEAQQLSSGELATLGRLISVLNDVGVQAYMSAFVLETSGYSEVALRTFGMTIQDMGNCSPEEMHKAGPSLMKVVDVARATRIFPEDFLPSEETVEKCAARFWESHR